MASTWGDFLLLAVTADAIYLCYSSMAGNLHTAPKCGFTGLQTFLSPIYIRHGLLQLFVSAHSGTVCINLGDVGAMAYSHLGQPLLTPRAFGVVEDIFCIFEGILDNVVVLRQRYGLNKSTDEMAIIIEAYRTLKDRGPYRADEVVRDLLGKFAFVLYEGTSEALFTAADADDSVPFFWGTAADDYLVVSDEPNVLKEGCGKSFAPFPEVVTSLHQANPYRVVRLKQLVNCHGISPDKLLLFTICFARMLMIQCLSSGALQLMITLYYEPNVLKEGCGKSFVPFPRGNIGPLN